MSRTNARYRSEEISPCSLSTPPPLPSRVASLLACYQSQPHLLLGLRTASLWLDVQDLIFSSGGASTMLARATFRLLAVEGLHLLHLLPPAPPVSCSSYLLQRGPCVLTL